MLSPYPLLNLMEGIRAEGLVNTHIVAKMVQECVLKLKIRFPLRGSKISLQEHSELIVQGEYYRLQFWCQMHQPLPGVSKHHFLFLEAKLSPKDHKGIPWAQGIWGMEIENWHQGL